MKNKIKFCIFIIETLILLVFIFIMILTRIYNNSFFSIFHINDDFKLRRSKFGLICKG